MQLFPQEPDVSRRPCDARFAICAALIGFEQGVLPVAEGSAVKLHVPGPLQSPPPIPTPEPVIFCQL
jgi:hypothetical protein